MPFPSPGDLPDPGIKRVSPVLAGRSLLLSHLGSPFQSVDVAYLKEPWSEEVS